MIIGWLNEKGGVGKTSLCFNVGWYIASLNKKVLFIDFDSQRANLSFFCGIKDREKRNTIIDVFMQTCGIKEAIVTITDNLHIIPANAGLADMSSTYSVKALNSYINEIREEYDYIFMDVSPSPSRCHILTMGVADYVVFPMLPDAATLEANVGIIETYSIIKKDVNPRLQIMGIVFNKYDGRLNLTKDVTTAAEHILQPINSTMFTTRVRQNVALSENVAAHVGVTEYSPKSNGAADIIALTSEILIRSR